MTRAGSSRDEHGAVAVVVTIFAVVMFGLAALVVDLGYARDVRRQAQIASDASALAAGNVLYPPRSFVPDIPAAVAAAVTYAELNYAVPPAAWQTCTDPDRPPDFMPQPGSPCVSFSPDLVKPEKIRVAVPLRQTPTFFAGALGLSPPIIGAEAEIQLRVSGISECALCLVGGGLHALQEGDVTVSGGDIRINGDVDVGHNGLVSTDGATYVEGTASGPLTSYDPDPRRGAHVVDPLAEFLLPAPPDYGLSTTPKTNPCADGPGIYGDWKLAAGANCTLIPGLYVITKDHLGRWNLAGNDAATVTGSGVTLYFTCGTPAAPRQCASGEEGARLDMSGQATVKLSPPVGGDLHGLVIAYDRNNTATYKMSGESSSTVSGTVYLASGTTVMKGNGCLSAENSLLITGDLDPNGQNSCLSMNYVPENNAQVPAGQLRLIK